MACHGIVRALVGWQQRGEIEASGVPWHFGAAGDRGGGSGPGERPTPTTATIKIETI